ncbi:MAG TPA: BrxA/BrxB family bacilliredoxin [Flavobacteriaceae bacterium]|nr:BrxA/BrxB family bacilliredoxin [Flavobacteriaceae bacterium]
MKSVIFAANLRLTKKIENMYPPELVQPMQAELEDVGFTSLTTANEVENAISKKGTTLVVVNSVCGCAAGTCRPGAVASLKNNKKPDNLITVFAGVDTEATAKAREFMLPFPPSSPSIALFKDGELVHMLERHHIEGRPAEAIAANLEGAYDEYC